MLAIIKKTCYEPTREYEVYSADGHICTVDGVEREYLEPSAKNGTICIDEYRKGLLYAGNTLANGVTQRTEFEYVKPDKWNGQARLSKIGRCLNENNECLYTLTDRLCEKGSFWIFKSGYIYYEMKDVMNNCTYIIKDICFGSDMHYYYIYDETEALNAVIYKPYRNPGKDEYHIYSKEDKLYRSLLFFVTYIDFFNYPYRSSTSPEWQDNRGVYEDDAAYTISEDELLQLYDENFTRSVILHDC